MRAARLCRPSSSVSSTTEPREHGTDHSLYYTCPALCQTAIETLMVSQVVDLMSSFSLYIVDLLTILLFVSHVHENQPELRGAGLRTIVDSLIFL